MFGTSTASTYFGNFVTDVKGMIGDNLPIILGLVAALIGLGWAYRKFKSHVSGKKF